MAFLFKTQATEFQNFDFTKVKHNVSKSDTWKTRSHLCKRSALDGFRDPVQAASSGDLCKQMPWIVKGRSLWAVPGLCLTQVSLSLLSQPLPDTNTSLPLFAFQLFTAATRVSWRNFRSAGHRLFVSIMISHFSTLSFRLLFAFASAFTAVSGGCRRVRASRR